MSNAIDTAVIAAAGLGSRLKDHTTHMPKGFLEVGGQSLIQRSINTLRSFGIRHIWLGTGYHAKHYDALADADPDIHTVLSPVFATTSSMYTLYNMRNHVSGPFLLLESDLLYEPRALAELLGDPREDIVLGSDATDSGDEVYIETDDEGLLIAMSKDESALSRVNAELVGISKVSAEGYRGMCAAMEECLQSNPKLDYESALVEVAKNKPVHVLRADGLAWCEIDDESHLQRALTRILPRIDAAASRPAAR